MKIRLGYACISKIIDVTSSKTTTLTYYKKLDTETKIRKIDKIINENLDNLLILINYNIKNNIHFFRMTSKLIPLFDLYDFDLSKYENKINKIGKLINKYNMRVDVHIEPFCVLNSVNEKVVYDSIKLLNNMKKIMDLFNIRYYFIMHIGSKTNGKKESINRFITNYELLNNDIKKLIILENDDKTFNVVDTLKICEKLGIPMCLDIHHHYCNKCRKSIEEYLPRIYNTYNRINAKMHYSSPKSKKEVRAHNEYIDGNEFIDFINILKKYDKDTDIMLEAKAKDLALVKLVSELKYKTNYKFIDESSFTP